VFGRLKDLFRNLVVYGLGDTATQIISFFLLPIYARYLTTSDYGVLALLLTIEVVTKVIFRWGIDGAFMRLYFDCPDQPARQRLASTQFYFLLVANGALLALGLIGAAWLGPYLFHTDKYNWTMRLVLINTFVVGFYYLPFHVMRIESRTGTFMTLGVARSLATILMRLLLIIVFGWGVHGVVLSDIVVTTAFTIVLLRWFAPLIRPVFSRELLRESLRFGLPRLPHGVAQQVISSADRYVLGRFVSLHELGLYSTGASFGQGLKLFLSSFEQAWAPFYFGVMGEPDAKQTLARVTTYGIVILSLLVSGLAACARDLVTAAMPAAFHPAADVVPWIGLGVALQGVYLLTSIGLNITKHTEYYPMATAIAAATSIGANLALVPSFGIIGAAWANVMAYSVLSFVSWRFASRFYPMQYELGRVARGIGAGIVALLVARLIMPPVRPVFALFLHGTIVVIVFFAVLIATRFFVPHEIAEVAAFTSRVRRRKVVELPPDATELAGELVSTPVTDNAVVVDDIPVEAGLRPRDRQ
jgi:O-antigen/teichoic acid export membrane protein